MKNIKKKTKFEIFYSKKKKAFIKKILLFNIKIKNLTLLYKKSNN